MKNGNCFDWLTFAKKDYDVCNDLLIHQEKYVGIIAYHAQQSAEKAFKAFLKMHNKEISKTHNLQYLIRDCFFIDASFAGLQKSALTLNPFYAQTRYPDDLDIALNYEQTLELVQHAEKILKFVTKKINK